MLASALPLVFTILCLLVVALCSLLPLGDLSPSRVGPTLSTPRAPRFGSVASAVRFVRIALTSVLLSPTTSRSRQVMAETFLSTFHRRISRSFPGLSFWPNSTKCALQHEGYVPRCARDTAQSGSRTHWIATTESSNYVECARHEGAWRACESLALPGTPCRALGALLVFGFAACLFGELGRLGG